MKKTLLVIVVTTIIVACGSQKTAPSNSSKKIKKSVYQKKADLFQNVKYLIGREQYNSAILNIDRIEELELRDNDYEPYRYKAMILQVTGKKEEANQVYETIINALNASAGEKKKSRQLMAINNNPPIAMSHKTATKKDSISSKEAFKVIEMPPVYPGCENLPRESQTKCMSQKVAKHIVKTIDVNIAQVTDHTGFIRSYVNYEIDTTGTISKIRTSGKNKFLNLEAHRVMAQLPKVIPGMQLGKKVAVPYTIPIRFATN
ncbi:hypothetical protein [Nonlabens sp.]|uniref:hypothetical protein n=1 Tax=Nonlabens sp. TaxID=1888209 RepID=UPI003F6A4EE1